MAGFGCRLWPVLGFGVSSVSVVRVCEVVSCGRVGCQFCSCCKGVVRWLCVCEMSWGYVAGLWCIWAYCESCWCCEGVLSWL